MHKYYVLHTIIQICQYTADCLSLSQHKSFEPQCENTYFLTYVPNENSISLLIHAVWLILCCLPHSILNKLSPIIYWKSPISILGMSGYVIKIFPEKNG